MDFSNLDSLKSSFVSNSMQGSTVLGAASTPTIDSSNIIKKVKNPGRLILREIQYAKKIS